jgi:alkanesulfonate monooxygenase SsuD/methylene tetrahydromethanopterin reductase-like flavin-dependent oxidoreductase (luciferase family)
MEGLAGASMNMKMMNTPFRVYQEAERRGDTSVMERAMGYVGETADKAEDYQKKIEKGMKEEAKEAREKAKSEQENAVRKRKEERGEQEKRIAESRNGNTDTVSISENGKAILGDRSDQAQAGTVSNMPVETADAVKTEPVIYTKTGEAAKSESGTNISVSA